MWVQASYRLQDSTVIVDVWEAHDRGPSPHPVYFVGVAIRAVHIGLGGSETKSESLVYCSPMKSASTSLGATHSAIVAPSTEAMSLPVDVLKLISTYATDLVGSYGSVAAESGAVHVTYGGTFGREVPLRLAANMKPLRLKLR